MAASAPGSTGQVSPAQRFAQIVARWAGSTPAFAVALAMVLAWAISGPFFHYSDTWQLVMNTASSIVTFLMVFLIQRSQNKDSLAMHVKLNEIVKAVEGASNRIVNVEDLSEAELLRLQERYQGLARRATKTAESGRPLSLVSEAQQSQPSSASPPPEQPPNHRRRRSRRRPPSTSF